MRPGTGDRGRRPRHYAVDLERLVRHRIIPGCVVLAFHGGGFTGGQPADVQPVVDGLRQRGISAKAVTYPLGSIRPAYRSAIRQVRRYQRRGHRVIAYGHSAGATIALYLSATRHVPAVAMSPVADFAGWRLPAGLEEKKGPDWYDMTLSPIERLTRRSGRATILHSANDSIVPYALSARYSQRARTLRRRVELLTTHSDHHPAVGRAVRATPKLARRCGCRTQLSPRL
jgi:acetyl esterase/lipase